MIPEPSDLNVFVVSSSLVRFHPPSPFNSNINSTAAVHYEISSCLTPSRTALDIATLNTISSPINPPPTSPLFPPTLSTPPPSISPVLISPSCPLHTRLISALTASPPSPTLPPQARMLLEARSLFHELLLSLPQPPPPPLPLSNYKTLHTFLQNLPTTFPTVTLNPSPPTLNLLNMQHRTSEGRTADFVITLEPDPSNTAIYHCAIPTPSAPTSAKIATTGPISHALHTVLTSYVTYNTSLSPYFSEFALLDASFHILDPPLPSTAPHRRVLCYEMGDGGKERPMSFEVEVLRGERPREFPPGVKIHGDRGGEALKKWRAFAAAEWSGERSVVDNLRASGVVVFEEKGAVQEGQEGVECAICYAYVLGKDEEDEGDVSEGNNELPDAYCTCGRQYHVTCLREWCRSGTGRVVMGRVYGNCPYCEASISCTA